jgi:hypothetical protein
MLKLRSALSVLALATAALGASNSAHASFVYSVTPVTTSTNFGAGSNLTVTSYNNGAVSPPLSGTENINLAQITQTSTTIPPATDTAIIPLAPLLVTITNGGSSAFTVSGNLNVTRSDTQGVASTFVLTSILPPTITLGGFNYALSNPTYAPPTIASGSLGNGALSITVTETPVPEPASLAVLGVGGLALLCPRRRVQA